MTYQSFIGLEVHIHLLTKTKAFCTCRSAYGDEPNTNVCPGCLGYPGTLPVLNLEAMRMGCITARALNCTIPEQTWFERKHYFYPDIAKNYQITQFASPLGQRGYIELDGQGAEGNLIKKKVRIKECHLEEDAGKMIHTGTVSLVDYNRAGVSLLEIVTEPDLTTGEEAEFFIQELRRMVRYLGVCDGNMEEGSLRADANVSINFPGQGLGRRVEIKNLNSSRFVRLALNHEIQRHAEMLDSGQTIVQETRLWNENRGKTFPMRKKENAQDYRYMPDPDLPVFRPDAAFRKSVEDRLVELPLARVPRLKKDYGLTTEQAALICDEKEGADYFEAAVAAASGGAVPGENTSGGDSSVHAARIANWFLSDIRHILSQKGMTVRNIASLPLTPRRLAALALMLASGKITGKLAKQCMELVVAEDREPEEIVKEHNFEQLTDPEKIAEAVKAVFAAEEKAAAELRAIIAAGSPAQANTAGGADTGGQEKRRRTLTAYLTGKVLAATGGRADPKIAGEQLEKQLLLM